ncbi:MAG: AAA family ATPase [Syntrophobacterales bacterium]|nr:AAA family ATPase [Syntrophobacterales bacterium]
MILQELILQPFAGLPHQKLSFRPGLNVVLGPNEAGKSTIVNALKLALFVPTRLTKTQLKNAISPFLPLTGGDTIQVELVFSCEPTDQRYRLVKSWGAQSQSRLYLPDGTFLADPESVQEKMRELLVLTEGTYHHILFAYQSHLGTTLEALRKEPDPRFQLADLLRRSLFETDGVSVDRLKQRLEDRLRDFFSRWDRTLERPEGNRGIEHPWEKGVGKILAAYYEKERLRQALRNSRDYEDRLDRLNERLHQVGEERQQLQARVNNHRTLAADARQRQVLEARCEQLDQMESHLKEIATRWPVLEQKVKDSAAALEKHQKRLEGLEEELARAKVYESRKDARERLQRAEMKRRKLAKAEAGLSRLRLITETDLQALEESNLRRSECRAALQAGKLSLAFTPFVPLTLQAARDLDPEEPYVLKPGQTLELDAGGRLTLKHPDWELRVKSGEVDFEELAAEYERASREFQGILTRLGLRDMTEAREAYKTYTAQVQLVETLKKELEEILAGQSWDELRQAVQEGGLTPPTRPATEVAQELGEIKGGLSQAQRELAQKQEQLSQWQEAYRTLDDLLGQLADLRAQRKRMAQELAALKPLPEGFADAAAFIAACEEEETRLGQIEREYQELLLQRAELQGQSPNETAEEIAPQLREAERRFEEIRQTGEALRAIQKALVAVQEEMDGQTLTPWLANLERFLGHLTGGRYVTLELPERDPGAAVRHDGLRVPEPLLSGGAKVSFGLAVRLSMAAHFLRDLRGFLVLDDPLVDLDDTGRQQAAVQVLQEFARDEQVIVLTCKQAHADLLGGHGLRLER